jgi:hypothetical protein
LAIPDFQTLMRPLLELASDGKEHSLRAARNYLAIRFKLTDEERNALLPSGRQESFGNRVAWAKVYLQRAGILEAPHRGYFAISERGKKVLQEAPERITINYLNQFPEFVDFRSERNNDISSEVDQENPDTANADRAPAWGATVASEESGVERERPEDLNIAVPFDPDQIEVTTKTMTIDLILSRIASGAIDLQPDFQRRWGIWSIRRQSRLIESLLLRIPLPTFYAAEDENENWEVVDGIQRLSTIARFMQPSLLHDEGFALEGLEYLHEFEGRRCDGLSLRLQRRMRETELVVHLIRYGTPLDVKFNIFARINTGGMALTAQELRHAIIPGRARMILEQWARSVEFKQATADSIRDDRMEDRELVLRFIAFWMTSYEEYRDRDLDSFLADAMKRLNVSTDDEIAKIRQRFDRAMIAAYELFEGDAFRKRYTMEGRRSLINKALFEALSVNLAKLEKSEISRLLKNTDRLRIEFIALCNDRDFDSAISQGTSDPRKVKIRFTKIAELLQKVI